MWVSLMCYSVLFPSDELRVGTRHPADAISEGNSKPAICGSSDVLKGCARSNRGQSGVLCAIACADIDLAAFRDLAEMIEKYAERVEFPVGSAPDSKDKRQ